MSHLSLYFLGYPRIEKDGVPIEANSRKAAALLCYLAVTGQTYSRDALSNLLWPEYDQTRARAALRSALSTLNKILGKEWSESRREEITLRKTQDIWLDVAEFHIRLAECRKHGHRPTEACHECVKPLAEAIGLYRDDFLAGFSLRDSLNFDDWQFLKAQSLRSEVVSALDRVVRWHSGEGETQAAIGYSRRWLELDETDERAHRHLMELHARTGERGAALSQYEECVKILKRETGQAPHEATTRLYKTIVENKEPAADLTSLRFSRFSQSNLPAQLTSFIGREVEMAEVKRLLSTSRLLTLTGSGGCGKTRLALEVASDLEGEYRDGVWFVELASLGNPAFIPQAIASVLGVHEQPGCPLMVTISEYLKPKEMLLILDNCEHLISASASLSDALLRTCSGLRILATSREALGIAGETAWRVPSLSMPDPASAPRVSSPSLTHYESVGLFIDRATSALPSFTMTDRNAPSVVQICHRLDGIPLAIELAAARAKVLSVEQIAERLDDRFRLLTGGSRTAPPRHQTLKAAMDWSYDLLSDGEKALLRRLSVFAGGWTLAAAEAVCADMLPPAPPFYALPTSSLLPLPPAGGGRGGGGGLGWGGKVGNDKALPLGGAEKAGVVDPIIHPGDILDLLTQLVNKSLVVMMEERGAEARYRLLETVRQYALEKLQESGEEAPLRSRHLGWFLGLAERAEQELRGRDQAKWIEHLESEHDNLRAALEWSKLALSRSNVTLSQSPEPFGPERASEPALSRSSERSEEETKGQAPRRGSEGTSEEPERSEGEGKEGASESTLRLAGALGWFWYVRGYFSEGRGWLEGMLSGSKGISAPVLAKAVNGAGLLAWGQGDHLRAAELCEESLAMYRGLGEVDGMAHSLFILGIVGEYQGDHERARALLEESLSLFREVGDKWGAAHSLRILGGMIWASQGDHERAEAQLEESLSLFREVGDKGGIAYSLISLSIKAFGQGDHKRAATMLEESISLFQEIGDKSGVSISLLFMGVARLHQRDFGQAGVLFEESLALRGEMGDKAGIAGCLEGLAAVAGLQGRLQRAARLVGAAKALREATGIPLRPHFRADYDRIVSAVRLRLGEEGFEAASEEGRKMTLEQAIQYGRSAEEHSSQATYSAAATAPQPTIPATLYPAGLTAREVEVLRLVAMGLTNAQVAEKLDVSARTIDSHLWLVYRKIGVSSRTAAARYAIDHKLA